MFSQTPQNQISHQSHQHRNLKPSPKQIQKWHCNPQSPRQPSNTVPNGNLQRPPNLFQNWPSIPQIPHQPRDPMPTRAQQNPLYSFKNVLLADTSYDDDKWIVVTHRKKNVKQRSDDTLMEYPEPLGATEFQSIEALTDKANYNKYSRKEERTPVLKIKPLASTINSSGKATKND